MSFSEELVPHQLYFPILEKIDSPNGGWVNALKRSVEKI